MLTKYHETQPITSITENRRSTVNETNLASFWPPTWSLASCLISVFMQFIISTRRRPFFWGHFFCGNLTVSCLANKTVAFKHCLHQFSSREYSIPDISYVVMLPEIPPTNVKLKRKLPKITGIIPALSHPV